MLLLEDVLDFFAGLLEVALGLIAVALRFEGLIAGGFAEAFLDLALAALGGVLNLVLCTRRAASCSLEEPEASGEATRVTRSGMLWAASAGG